MTDIRITIEHTLHGQAVILRIPDRRLRIAMVQEEAEYVDGEMGRAPIIHHRIPEGFPLDPRAALLVMADILNEEIEKEGGEE